MHFSDYNKFFKCTMSKFESNFFFLKKSSGVDTAVCPAFVASFTTLC